MCNNLDNVCLAVEQLKDIVAPKFNFIFTTVGLSQSLRKYISEYSHLPINWHWSLISLIPSIRGWLMPGVRYENLYELRAAFEKISMLAGKTITASWTLIKGVNDREKDAVMIAKFLNNRPFTLKLMALVDGSFDDVVTTDQDVEEFKKICLDAGVTIPIRIKKIFGKNIASGCGNVATT